MAITLDGTSGITTPTYNGADTSEYVVPVTAFKNRIINGAMMISQRNGTSSITATDGSFGVDRFKTAIVGSGVFTMQQSTTAPTGFSFSQILTVTTADSSIAASDEYSYRHFVEGFNFADMMWGTANAQTVTLSFWVRSSVTGTYAVGLRNDAANRTYPATYTISAANTWEQKTITIAGDTTGTWVGATNGVGVGVIFSLGAGSNFQGTANSWNAGNVWSTSSATQWISTNGATFYITGVQLEKGSTATSFDYRPYGTELALCQRYYEKSFEQAIAPANGATGTSFASNLGLFGIISTNKTSFGGNQIPFKVAKRTSPTITKFGNSSGNWGYLVASGTSLTWSSFIDLQAVSENGFIVSQQVVDGTFVLVNGHWTASAEL